MTRRPLLSQLLNMLAPDVRSSLGELQGTLHLIAHDLAAQEPLDSLGQRRIDLVANAQQRVNEFRNMLSIVSQLDALNQGGLKPAPECIDLVRLFEQIAHRLNLRQSAAPIRLDILCDPQSRDSARSIWIDSGNLRQLLVYIMRFAWATTQHKKVSVDIGVTMDQLTCVITNHGASVSSTELDQLVTLQSWPINSSFRLPFDDPTQQLGLSLSVSIARAMNGTCEMSSDSDQGLIWNLVLPLSLPAMGNAGSVAADLVEVAADQSPPQVLECSPKALLLVDDSDSSRMVTRALLEGLGHSVVEAANGFEALVQLRMDPHGPFDGVIMDLAMPQMDGLSAARAIRELPSSARLLQLIALTGHSSIPDQLACREAGFNDFLCKPLDKGALERCLERTLGVSSVVTSAVTVNLRVLEALLKVVGPDAASRLLPRFIEELDQRMEMISDIDKSNLDDVRHNLQMMRYSAEHFGFEQLALSAKQLEETHLRLQDVAMTSIEDGSPKLVVLAGDAVMQGIKQLQAHVLEANAYVRSRPSAGDTTDQDSHE